MPTSAEKDPDRRDAARNPDAALPDDRAPQRGQHSASMSKTR
jgi:hypothetical protein